MSQISRRVDSLVIARGVALAITGVMVYYFPTSDAIRSDNPFLVPDLLLTLLLVMAALAPRRVAIPGLLFAFAFATAVYTVSMSTYTVRGEFTDGADHVALITPMLVMSVLLARELGRAPIGAPRPGPTGPDRT